MDCWEIGAWITAGWALGVGSAFLYLMQILKNSGPKF